jgi:tetratricopeptide (TPR) repeat protein
MSKQNDDIDFEIQFYEGIVKRKPDFAEALAALGDLYTKTGMYEKGLNIDEKLCQLKPDDGVVHYNLACSYSLLNRIDASFRAMQRAIECGYNNFHFLERDKDLENLRDDERFEDFFVQVKNKKRKHDKNHSQ